MHYYTVLNNRSFLTLEGPDRFKFLQGLITNDINKVSEENCLYAALLTPQGRFLHDFFIYQANDKLYLDVRSDRVEDLLRRLNLYKLRSNVNLRQEDASIICLFGDDISDLEEGQRYATEDFIAYVDPRLKDQGLRVIFSDSIPDEFNAQKVSLHEYEELRLRLGLPEAGSDMLIEKEIPLEAGLDELHAIDWNKGCYLGQELNARTKHRGQVRKRLFPVEFEGNALEPLSVITWNGKKVGTMRSSHKNRGIARLSIEAVTHLKEGEVFQSGETKVKPFLPNWIRLPLD